MKKICILSICLILLCLVPWLAFTEDAAEQATAAEPAVENPAPTSEEEETGLPLEFNVNLFYSITGFRYIDYPDISENLTKVSNFFGAGLEVQILDFTEKLFLVGAADISFDIGFGKDEKSLVTTDGVEYGHLRYENSLNITGGGGIYFYPTEKLRIAGLVTAGMNRIALEVDDAIGFGTQISTGFLVQVKAAVDFHLLTFGKDMKFFLGGEIAGKFSKVSVVRQTTPSLGIRTTLAF